VWSAACFCFFPSFLGFANLLVSEVVFTLFVVMLLYFTIRGIKNQSLPMVLLSGIVLGLGALTRSILWLYLPFHVLMLVVVWPGKWRGKAMAALVMTVTVCLILAPWSYRNTVLQRTFVVVDVMGGRNVMMGNYDYTPLGGSWVTIAKTHGEQTWASVMRKDTPGFHEMTAGQKSDAALDYAKRYVLAHPVQTIQRDIVKFFNFWQLERTIVAGAHYGVFGDLPTAVIIVIAALVFTSYAALIFAAIFGVWCAPPKDKRIHFFFLLFIAVPCAVHTLIFAHSRYHLPLIPILVIYAVSAILSWSAVWEHRRSWRFVVAALMCLILVGSWAREIVMYDLHRSGWLEAIAAHFG
jgi:4-amino-4-deoxy-L-arabinose transferase-like glycosyltransferase